MCVSTPSTHRRPKNPSPTLCSFEAAAASSALRSIRIRLLHSSKAWHCGRTQDWDPTGCLFKNRTNTEPSASLTSNNLLQTPIHACAAGSCGRYLFKSMPHIHVVENRLLKIVIRTLTLDVSRCPHTSSRRRACAAPFLFMNARTRSLAAVSVDQRWASTREVDGLLERGRTVVLRFVGWLCTQVTTY